MHKTILVVDDSHSMRQAVSLALQGEGYIVIEAVDGKDALTKLDGRKYHLIISDFNMPHLDGLGFVKECKKNPCYQYTPVMMLTTENDAEKKRDGKKIGVRIWMQKPFVPRLLLDAVAKLMLP